MSGPFAKLNICAFDRETVMNKVCIVEDIVYIGSVKSGMNKDLSGNVFDYAIVTFTDPILMLMCWGSKGGSDFWQPNS